MKLYSIKKHKDGQITAYIDPKHDIECLHISERINSYEDLFKVAAIVDAARSYGISNIDLFIPCLFGQRGDARFNLNESFDLKIIANFINSLRLDNVYILHPHSLVSLALIENSIEVNPLQYISSVFKTLKKECLWVTPDAGAYKNGVKWAGEIGVSVVSANKTRINGEPKIQFSTDVTGMDCMIVDDLADGGRTFLGLAKALKAKGAEKVFLYVTHGQFNFGFDELLPEDGSGIDLIYTTNSYREIDHPLVRQMKLKELK